MIPGIYRVKYDGIWCAAEYHHNRWYVAGSENTLEIEDFDEPPKFIAPLEPPQMVLRKKKGCRGES